MASQTPPLIDPSRDQKDSRDDVGRFLDSAGRYPLLSADEEVSLARDIEAGRNAAERLDAGRVRAEGTVRELREAVRLGELGRRRFILANLRLVVSIAKKYQGNGLTLVDLIQEGTIGLMRAVDLFDWRRGFKFSTYATWWIRQAVSRAVEDRGRIIRIPVHLAAKVRKVRATARRLQDDGGEEPDVATLAEDLGITPEEVERLLAVDPGEPLSLETPIGEDGELSLADSIADDEEGPEDLALEVLGREALGRALEDLLSEQERRVITLRFGLDGEPPRSLAVVAKALGLSGERIRQIEKAALARLRESKDLESLAA
jgi:RNA polymerase primary sigma factor